MPTIKVPAALTGSNVNAYSVEGAASKSAFHRQGKSFLKQLADVLSPHIGAFSVRSNLGGMAVSGEVTLHGEHLYVQLYESAVRPGIQMMYRSCTSQKDYCGHRNHNVLMGDFLESGIQGGVLQTMLELIEAEQARKNETAVTR